MKIFRKVDYIHKIPFSYFKSIILNIPQNKYLIIDDNNKYANDEPASYKGQTAPVFSDVSEIIWANSTKTLIRLKTVEEIEAEEAAATEQAWQQIRNQRDALLTETDFTQLPDCPLSAEKITAYSTYRQALRDLPETYTSPYEVQYPEKP